MAKNNNKETSADTALATANVTTSALAESVTFEGFENDTDKRTADEVVTERYRLVQAMTKGKKDIGTEGQLYGNMTRKGFDQAIVVPLFDFRTVVERTNDDSGKFVKEHAELKADSGDFGPKVNAAIKAVNGKLKDLRESLPDNQGQTSQLVLTYNCYVAFLDETGTTALDFGVIQADKTNIRPYLLWRQNRVKFEGATSFPTFSFRTVVSGRDTYTNPQGKETANYRFQPFVDGNWAKSCIGRLDPVTKKLSGSAEEFAFLNKLKAQKQLMSSGAIKVAEYSDADDSEAAAEEAAF